MIGSSCWASFTNIHSILFDTESFHWTEITVRSNVISLFVGGSSGTEHTCLRKTFLLSVLYLSLHFPCFVCSAFSLGWISVEGPNVVLYCMKLLVNPQWTQFFGVVPCLTW